MSSPPAATESPNESPKPWSFILLIGFVLVLLGLLLGTVVSTYFRGQAQGRLGACRKSSLHSIAVALEMYSKDFDGQYPAKLSQLQPDYLRQIPMCPENESSYNYRTGHVGDNRDGRSENYFILNCEHGHSGLGGPVVYPQYDSHNGGIW